MWRRRGAAGGRGWLWFFAWLAVGFLLTFSFIAVFSLGLLVLPLAISVLIWVARRSARLPEASGFVTGIGVVLLTIAFINREYTPCGGGGHVLILPPAPAGAS